MTYRAMLLVPTAMICLVASGKTDQGQQRFDEAFFKGDPKTIMLACSGHARELKPGSNHVMAQIGRIQLAAGERPEAENSFKAATPADSESIRWMVQAWVEAGEPDKAADLLKQMPLSGAFAKDEFKAASVLVLKAGRSKPAEDLMEQLFALDARDWEDFSEFAAACLQEGHRDLAAKWYVRALAHERHQAALWNGIATAFASISKPTPSGSSSSSVIAVPEQPDEAFFLQDPAQLSAACLRESDTINHSDSREVAPRGNVWLSLGDKATANSTFSFARALDRRDPRTLRVIAQGWMSHGFKGEALKAYKELASLDVSGQFDREKNVLCWVATDLVAAGFPQEASGYMEKSYRLDDDDPNNFIDFGRAALLVGNRDLAATYFARAIQAEPRDVDVWLDIASAHADYLLRAAKAPR